MNSRGFTLIELMIVIVIIGILAAIGFPGYNDYMHKSRRGDAKTALLALQQLQEKLRGSCNVYGRTLNPTLVDADDNSVQFLCDPGQSATSALRFSGISEQKWYNISVRSADAIGYVAWAEATGRQSTDKNCQTIILTVDAEHPNGERTSTKGLGGAGGTSTGCW